VDTQFSSIDVVDLMDTPIFNYGVTKNIYCTALHLKLPFTVCTPPSFLVLFNTKDLLGQLANNNRLVQLF